MLVEAMLEAVRAGCPTYVADFAAGDGRLLKAAQGLWPQCQVIATDINEESISLLHCTEPTWKVGQCDFVETKSRNGCDVLKNVLGKVSLVLLNPPFSLRGGQRWTVTIGEAEVQCSIALAFVIACLPYLAPDGQIVAILPIGSICSERDKFAWEKLREVCLIKEIQKNSHNAFGGCSANTVIMRLILRTEPQHEACLEAPVIRPNFSFPEKGVPITLFRGKVPKCEADKEKPCTPLPYIHSTSLQATGIDIRESKVDSKHTSIKGPAVLLSRVGTPNVSKIQIYNSRCPIVLSDCVIALLCKSLQDAELVQATLLEQWEFLKSYYSGTGAVHITLHSLTQVLNQLGFSTSGVVG